MRHDAMAQLSLREAADACGVSKSTILRAIKSGRMSAPRTDDGGYAIDPAELHRVYPPRTTTAPERNGAMGQDTTPTISGATAMLDNEIASLREMLRRADKETEDLREDRDRWRNQAENAQRLITDQTTRSWWRRLVG